MTIRTPEAKVKIKLKEHLRRSGVYYFMPVQTGYGAPGLDFYFCFVGEFHAYETKARGAKLTPRQEVIAQQITAAGGHVYVVTLDDDGELEFKRYVAGQGPQPRRLRRS